MTYRHHNKTTTVTFPDDTAILATHGGPAIGSVKVRDNANVINDWAKKCRIKINKSNFTHISFTLRNQTCPTVQLGNVATIPPNKEVKYLGMYFDRSLTWTEHIKARRNQLNLQEKQLYWLLGTRSTLSTEQINYTNQCSDPFGLNGIQICETVSNSSIEILHSFQSSIFRSILNTP